MATVSFIGVVQNGSTYNDADGSDTFEGSGTYVMSASNERVTQWIPDRKPALGSKSVDRIDRGRWVIIGRG